MARHEHVLDHQGVAAGALEPDHVPLVFDLVVAKRHQEAAEIDRAAVLDHRSADEGPGGVVASRGPQPVAVDQVAAVDDNSGAHRRVRRRDPHRRVIGPDILLGLLIELGEMPVVHAEDRGGPTGGPAGAGDPAHSLEEQRGIALQAAPLLGLQHLEIAGGVEIGDRRVGKTAQILGLLVALAQPRQQFIDGGQNRLRVTLLDRCHCMPPMNANSIDQTRTRYDSCRELPTRTS